MEFALFKNVTKLGFFLLSGCVLSVIKMKNAYLTKFVGLAIENECGTGNTEPV